MCYNMYVRLRATLKHNISPRDRQTKHLALPTADKDREMSLEVPVPSECVITKNWL